MEGIRTMGVSNAMDILEQIKNAAREIGNKEIEELADQAAILVDGANEMLTGRRECGGKPSPLPR